MKKYEVGDVVLIRSTGNRLDQVEIENVIPRLFGTRYVVREFIQHRIEGIKCCHREVTKKEIVCIKETTK